MTYARPRTDQAPVRRQPTCQSGLLAFAFALSLNACGTAERQETNDGDRSERKTSPIYAGTVVDPALWPEVVWLTGACTATFISPQVIVYAAHCGDGFTEAQAGLEIFHISQCEVFPDFGLGKGSDIAYCTISSFSPSYILPAVGVDREEVQVGTRVTLIGYGESTDGQEAGNLRVGEAEVLEVGAELVVGHRNAPGPTPCPGDSGGPAIVTTPAGSRVLAVASTRLSRECDGSSSYYIPVEPWLAWIEQNAGLDPGCISSNCQQRAADLEAKTSGCAMVPGRTRSGRSFIFIGILMLGVATRRRWRTLRF